jgi:SAM-dependent methyltransferase
MTDAADARPWREHPLCASHEAWPARFWGPETLDPRAWRELAARLEPDAEITALCGVLERARGGQGARVVVDVGGGTGLLTRAIAARFGRCVVVEPSAAQVAGLPPGLACVRGRGERLPIADASVDGAVATWVLQYCDDPFAVVAELARVVGPRGAIAIVQAAPDNDLVEIYNDEARVAGRAPAHHGFLLAGAAEVLARAGFVVAMERVEIAMRAAPDEAHAIADTLARLHFAGHPRLVDMIATTTGRIASAARARGHLRDHGVMLTGRR